MSFNRDRFKPGTVVWGRISRQSSYVGHLMSWATEYPWEKGRILSVAPKGVVFDFNGNAPSPISWSIIEQGCCEFEDPTGNEGTKPTAIGLCTCPINVFGIIHLASCPEKQR